MIVKKIPNVRAIAPVISEDLQDGADCSDRSSPTDGEKSNDAQAKANRIIQQAIAKAEAEGRPIPKACIDVQFNVIPFRCQLLFVVIH
jgi:hypothetical protein